ncbi:MAG: hypothetical protein K0B00_04135 [Rhodobacteraceae bacterium]|nr:hypothetical protein [Paracoccaceae bacterium]
MQNLGNLGGGWAEAQYVSADGAVVAGYSYHAANAYHSAFRWTEGDGMLDLGTLEGGTWSMARALSADGSVVVGDSGSSTGARAFIYRSQMLDLANTQTAMVQTAADLAAAGAQQLGMIGGLANTELGGAGNELVPTASSMGAMPARMPAVLRIGALYLRYRGTAGRGLTWKLALAGGGGTVDVRRSDALPDTEAGHGLADLQSRAMLAEVGWDMATAAGRMTPYLRLMRAQTTRGGYTEADDIDFPVTYAEQALDLTTATLGLAGKYRLNDLSTLRYDFGIEVDLARAAGQIIGTSDAGDFAIDTPAVANEARLIGSVGLTRRVGATGALTADLGVAQSPHGGRPAATLRLGYEMRF